MARTERVGEVAGLIDRLDVGDARRLSSLDVEARHALRRRFAVDFGWDLAAWRDWWARESGAVR